MEWNPLWMAESIRQSKLDSALWGDSPGVQFDARFGTAGCIATRLPTLPGRFLSWGQSKRFECLQIPEYQMRRVRVHSRFS